MKKITGFLFLIVCTQLVTAQNDNWRLEYFLANESTDTLFISADKVFELAFFDEKFLNFWDETGEVRTWYSTETLGRSDLENDLVVIMGKDTPPMDLTSYKSQMLDYFLLDSKSETSLVITIRNGRLKFTKTTSDRSLEPVDRCMLIPKGGPCRAMNTYFYFNQETRKCESFNWGGCGGNIPFETLEECQSCCFK